MDLHGRRALMDSMSERYRLTSRRSKSRIPDEVLRGRRASPSVRDCPDGRRLDRIWSFDQSGGKRRKEQTVSDAKTSPSLSRTLALHTPVRVLDIDFTPFGRHKLLDSLTDANGAIQALIRYNRKEYGPSLRACRLEHAVGSISMATMTDGKDMRPENVDG